MRELDMKVDETKIANEDEVSSYYRLREQLSDLSKQFHSYLVKPQYIIPFIQPGRLVSIKHGEKDFGYGAVVNFKKLNPKDAKGNPLENETNYVIDVLIHVTSDTAKSKSTIELMPAKESKGKGEMIVVPIFLNLIQQISSVKIFMPKDIRPRDNRMAVLKSIQVRIAPK